VSDGAPAKPEPEQLIEELRRELDLARDTIAELHRRNEAAEHTLREERDFAERLVDTAHVLVVVLDTWGRIVRVNNFFEELTGYAADDVVGESWFDRFLPVPDRARIRAFFAKAVAEGRVHGNLNPIVTRDGRQIPIEWYATTLRDRSGEAIGVLSVGADVSERMRAQATLRESEERYRALVEASPSSIAALRDGKIIFINRAGARLFGFDEPGEAIGTEVIELIAPEQRSQFAERLRYLADGLPNPLAETELQRRDGTRVTAESISVPITLGGEPAALIIGRDVTDHKRAENALRRAEQDWEDIFQAIGQPTVILSSDRRLIAANRATLAILDTTLDAIRGKHCHELFHGDGSPPGSCPLERLVESGVVETSVAQLETLGGWYLISCTPVLDERGQLDKIIHIATDISEHKRAEDALKASEDRYRTLVETSPDAIFLVDVTGRILSVNDQALRIAGAASADDLVGKSFYELVPATRRKEHAAGLQQLLGGEVGTTIEYDLDRPDGTSVTLEVRGALVRNDEGVPIALMGIARDVTARKRAARALAESEARFRATFEQAAVGIALAEPHGPFLRINQRFCDIVGYTEEELLTLTYMDITHPDDREPTRAFVEQAVSGRLEQPQMIKRYVRKDGSIAWIKLALSHVRDEQGELLYAIGVSEDISAQKRAEELSAELEAQLRQSQKMEAIGQLAGGVAHDFNNLLSPILIYSDLLLGEISSKDPRHHEIEQIRTAAARAKDLTQQLLAFGRKQVLSMKILDLNRVVSDLTRMLGRTLRENIHIELKLATAPLRFEGDLSQVEQILMNLAINARDAMPGGGRMTIETRAVTLDETAARELGDAAPGRYALLSLGDTGHGMDATTVSRVFEPFFSTKDRDKGTGLGLSTVYGIVKQHRGAIRVDSEMGRGTTFAVYLPLADMNRQAPEPDEAPGELVGGRETLLVVEDDEAVRVTTCRLLEHLGYRVLSAADGERAIEIVATAGLTIDLLVTDVIMPRMNGPELYDRLREARPGLPVLYISGYTGEALAEHGVLDQEIDYLPKPFTVSEISAKLREILDR